MSLYFSDGPLATSEWSGDDVSPIEFRLGAEGFELVEIVDETTAKRSAETIGKAVLAGVAAGTALYGLGKAINKARGAEAPPSRPVGFGCSPHRR
jgi:hypothetical protein